MTRSSQSATDAALLDLGQKLAAAEAEMLRIEREAPGEFERAYGEAAAIVHAIEQIAARTIDGIKVKARAVAWCCGEEPIEPGAFESTTDARIAFGIVRDIMSL